MYLSRRGLLDALRLRERDYTDEAIGTVRIRELTAAARLEAADAEEALKEQRGSYTALSRVTYWSHVAIAGVIDGPNGDPLFSEADLPTLLALRPDVLERLGTAILVWSEATPERLKSGDPEPDGGQLDAPGGAADPDGESAG